MVFEKKRERALKKFEKDLELRKVDKELVDFLTKFNKKKDCFTTSSCAGRILLLKTAKIEKKQPKAFVFKSHEKVRFEDVEKAFDSWRNDGILWLKLDSFILHICCRNMETAKMVLIAKERAGVKRGGVFYFGNDRVMVELIGTQKMQVPVKKDGEAMIDKKYLEYLVKKANEKLEINKTQMKELLNELLKI